ncbi:MAG TPA: hypothetical protein VMU16_05750 [Candidatus Binataceae bacterium]|nr:hypothetical protein [Candidatus Binataceae bacterium]
MANALSVRRFVVSVLGLIALGGLSGCDTFLWSKPLDCSTVKLQAESGRDDAEIASATGASVDEVSRCHRGDSSANDGGAMPSGF